MQQLWFILYYISSKTRVLEHHSHKSENPNTLKKRTSGDLRLPGNDRFTFFKVFGQILVISIVFHPLTADTLLTLRKAELVALERSFPVRIDKENRSAQKWSYWNAIGGYLPKVNGSSQYLRLGGEVTGTFPGTTPVPTIPGTRRMAQTGPGQPPPNQPPTKTPDDFYIHELSVQQPIANGGAEIIGIRLANAAKKAAAFQSEATRQEVIFEVKNAYFDAVSAQARLDVARLSLELAQKNLAIAQIRQETGVVPITEVLRWRAQMAENDAALARAKTAVETSRLALFSAMGYSIDSTLPEIRLQTVEFFAHQCTTVTLSIDTIDSIPITNNPSFKALQKGTEIANFQKQLAFTQYLPRLNGFYSLQWQATEPIPEQDGTWYLGLSLSISLFSGFTTTSGYLQEKANYKRTLIEENEARNGFLVQARSAARAYVSTQEQLSAALLQKDLMDQTLKIMQARYESGIANQTDLLEVTISAERARIGYIQALFDCLSSRARFQLAIGTLEVFQ